MSTPAPDSPAAGRTSPTGWLCGACHTVIGEQDTLCPACGVVLNRSRRRRVPVTSPADASPAGTLADASPAAAADQRSIRNCPYCTRPLHDADAIICMHCTREVPPAAARPSRPAPAPPGTQPDVELRFKTGGVIRIHAGAEALIGRAGTHGSRQVFHELKQISRQHARIRVNAQGRAEISDSGSANGTFVDDERVTKDWRDLPIGAELRLGQTVTAVVGRTSGNR